MTVIDNDYHFPCIFSKDIGFVIKSGPERNESVPQKYIKSLHTVQIHSLYIIAKNQFLYGDHQWHFTSATQYESEYATPQCWCHML